MIKTKNNQPDRKTQQEEEYDDEEVERLKYSSNISFATATVPWQDNNNNKINKKKSTANDD